MSSATTKEIETMSTTTETSHAKAIRIPYYQAQIDGARCSHRHADGYAAQVCAATVGGTVVEMADTDWRAVEIRPGLWAALAQPLDYQWGSRCRALVRPAGQRQGGGPHAADDFESIEQALLVCATFGSIADATAAVRRRVLGAH